MYKQGCTNRLMVRQIQESLSITIDGNFGPKTTSAVVNFQSRKGLVADGIVGRKTLDAMGILDTDNRLESTFRTAANLAINRHHLPKAEYIQGDQNLPILNDYMMLHHTGGWDNPYNCVDDWARDDRGRIATEFVVGGQNFKTNDDIHDGVVVQAFPEGGQGWHIGASGSYYMNRHTVGIEVCNFGQLTHDNKNYVGIQAHADQVVTLDTAFRGHTKWHKYSDTQLKSMRKLILHVANRDSIDIRLGLVQWLNKGGVTEAFGFKQEAYEGKVKGLLLHCNVRKDKVDMFPQPELIDMLLSL